MPDPIFNTSIEKTVSVPIKDWNSLLPVITYSDKTTLPAVPIDLTTFYFLFELKRAGAVIATYEIHNGEMATAYLTKGGTGNATLNMQGMFEDIRAKTTIGKSYSLTQKVTDDQGLNFVHIIYKINVQAY